MRVTPSRPVDLPFCISGAELKPVYHLGATLGEKVPFWDARDGFGDTTLIVAKPRKALRLRATRASWIVLMRRQRRDGRGRTLEELTFRTIYASAQCGAADSKPCTRPCLAAQSSGDRTCRKHYNLRPGPVAACLGILERAAGQARGTLCAEKANPRPKKKSPPKRKTKRRRKRG